MAESKVCEIGSAFIKDFEGLHDGNKVVPNIQAYHDIAGFPTIGFGHLLSRLAWEPLSKYPSLTARECEDLLESDYLEKESKVLNMIKPRLTKNKLAALVSFSFNLGSGALFRSTMRQRINAGDFACVPTELLKWNKAGGLPVRGLTRRRVAEAALWSSG